MSQPVRAVVVADLADQPSRAGGHWRSRTWHLTLDCGHTVIRPVSYRGRDRRHRGPRNLADVLPAQTRSHCDQCPAAPNPTEALSIRATGGLSTVTRIAALVCDRDPLAEIRGPYARVNGYAVYITTRAELYDQLAQPAGETE